MFVPEHPASLIQPLLFQQSARDPLTYGLVAILLLAVAALASAIPAVRATQADPNSALRVDQAEAVERRHRHGTVLFFITFFARHSASGACHDDNI